MVCSDAGELEIDESDLAEGGPTLCDVLKDETRRRALIALDGVAEPISLAGLAAEVVRLEERDRGDVPRGPNWDRIEKVRTVLYHWHVPMLEDAGLVEYNGREKSVRLTRGS